jgi:hypothetical protein
MKSAVLLTKFKLIGLRIEHLRYTKTDIKKVFINIRSVSSHYWITYLIIINQDLSFSVIYYQIIKWQLSIIIVARYCPLAEQSKQQSKHLAINVGYVYDVKM